MIPLETARLRLRPFTAADLDYHLEVMQRPDVVRYLPWGVLARDAAADLLARRMRWTSLARPGDTLVLAVERQDSGQVIGDVMLRRPVDLHRQAELGYVFHPDAHGSGYATEAARAMLALGFEHAGLHRIFARCDARNAGSIRVMERLGMRREAHLREHARADGEWVSQIIAALLAREWAACRPTSAETETP